MKKKSFPTRDSRLHSLKKDRSKYKTSQKRDDASRVYIFVDVSLDESTGMYRATVGECVGFSESKERAIGIALKQVGGAMLDKHKRFAE